MTPLDSFYQELLAGLLRPQFVLSSPSLSHFSELDYVYCLTRFNREGVTFLSVALYQLRVATDAALEEGRFECPQAFKRKNGTALPAFLFSHFERVFTHDGLVRVTTMEHMESLTHIRQVTSSFYKMEFPIDPRLEKSALDRFMCNEAGIQMFWDNKRVFAKAPDLELESSAALLIRKLFEGFDPSDIRPRHGPGSVATGEVGLEKWLPSRVFYTRLHQKFPYYRYMYHNTSLLGDLASEYRKMDRPTTGLALCEPVSKVALVPKDSRGPRIIALEPLEVQYIQQGLRVSMTEWIESHSLTQGQVNFTDQKVNQRLALESSSSREWATIDMKDASDLVSVDLVKLVFRLKPALLDRLLACRTQVTRFPDGREVPLRKFAGMGAATCFPVEALVFWTIAVTAIAKDYGADVYDCTHLCYVYGDDLIIPSFTFQPVVEALESVGLIVNKKKSYYRGWFRESCGVDAYHGKDVTPTRFSKLPPASLRDGVSYAAWVAYANAFEAKGYDLVASAIYGYLEKLFGPIPYGTDRSPFPCRIVADPDRAEELNSQFLKRRVRKRYQRIEFYVYYIKSPKHLAQDFDGWARLNRNLISGPGDDPSEYVLPREAKVFRGWMAV